MKQNYFADVSILLSIFSIVGTISSCASVGNEPIGDNPTVFSQLQSQMPEDPVINIRPPVVQNIDPLFVSAKLPARGGELVRMTRNGMLLNNAERFRADILKVEPDIVQLSDNVALAIRLPKNEKFQFPLGTYIFDLKPTTTAGSDETSVTVFSIDKNDGQAGPIVLQAVQRGSDQPVQIHEAQFKIEQAREGKLVLKSETEATYNMPVRFSSSDISITIMPDSTEALRTKEIDYQISVIRSLFVEHFDSRYSNEGPTYYLEYVITQINDGR